jgi:hypothetical protein
MTVANYLLRNTFEKGANGAGFLSVGSEFDGDQLGVTDPGGTMTYDNTQSAVGSQSLRLNATTNCYLKWLDEDLGRIGGSYVGGLSTSYTRMYLRLPALPSSTRRIMQVNDSAGTQCAAIEVLTSGVIRVKNVANTLDLTSIALNANEWVRLELKVVHGAAGNAELRVYQGANVNGTTPDDTQTTATTADYGLDANEWRIGSTASIVQDGHLDDIAISDVDWCGPASPGMLLDRWVGNVTATSFSVNTNTIGIATGRIGYSVNSDYSAPTYTGYGTADATTGYTRFDITGLDANTVYYFFYEDDNGVQYQGRRQAGSLTTHPVDGVPATFKFVVGSCMTSLSIAESFMAASDEAPLFTLFTGDLHYEDVEVNSPSLMRDAYRQFFRKPVARDALYAMPMHYTWDDHDFAGNNSDGTAVAKPAAQSTYRDRVPHYPLPASDSINHTFVVGRVRFIVLDCRSFRSPTVNTDDASKTMIGATQKAWLKSTLLAATEPVKIIVSSAVWNASSTVDDTWGAYTTERTELINYMTTNSITGVHFVSGDTHMLAADDGTNAPGGYPCIQSSPFNNNPSIKGGGTWSEGFFPPTEDGLTYRLYGLVTVTDNGSTINVDFEGKDSDASNVVRVSLASSVTAAYAGNASYTSAAKDAMLDAEFVNGDLMSLHTADPALTGANELTGGGYARQAIAWNASSGGVKAISSSMSFSVPIADFTHFTIWDSTGTTVKASGALGAAQSYPSAGTYNTSGLSITLS